MTTDLEKELQASIRLALEFSAQGDTDAGLALKKARGVLLQDKAGLLANVQLAEHDPIPHEDIEWHEPRTEGKGGRRSIQEYRDLAWAHGFILPDKIGWMPARDAGRAIECADTLVKRDHINIHTEGQWLRDLR